MGVEAESSSDKGGIKYEDNGLIHFIPQDIKNTRYPVNMGEIITIQDVL